MKLVTHNGTFHADDVTAHAILARLYPGSTLVRTRDQDEIAGADIVFDVGAAYSHESRIYDHHQNNGPKRDDGSPYSSVGLIWKHYGIHYLEFMLPDSDQEELKRVWASVDGSLIKEIDLLDNGMGTSTGSGLPMLVEDFNPPWDAPRNGQDAAFLAASAFADRVLERRIATAAAAARAFGIVTDAASQAADPRIVVLPSSMPWERGIFEGGFDQALYIVYERDGTWYLSAVPPEPGSFGQRKPLPAEWAGLRDEALAEETGIADAVFCHPARFICGAKSLGGILGMAKNAADWPENEPSPGMQSNR